MAALRNYYIGKNVNFTFSWKNFTFFFLLLSYLTYNDVNPFCKIIENIYEQYGTSNTKITRLLAKYEQLRELESTRLREKLSDRSPYTEKSNVSNNIKTYSHVKRNVSNNIDVYMKNYKRRYGKKKGLSRLDCYYENKVFRKINHICDVAEKLQYDKKRSKRFFFKKYGIGLIIFALIPALGLIFPMLFGINDKTEGILGYCPRDHIESGSHKTNDSFATCGTKWIYKNRETIENVGYSIKIFSFIMIIIVIIFIIYILIKVIKYEKLKAGKGKLNINEYCRFCKEIFK
ncbi:Plasmodium exported protein, unknown function [Plasmodium vivax]|uniref:Variable surface protein n=1 Tax=Plasmodium vivax TaxID=5855 RepID=A0A564ZYG4_PLAVI|nr:Plasmodium exported protein, unknown function [Plasmodium vivax]